MSDDRRDADRRDPNPEARAFTGHPDHPPASPDQPLEGNRELLDSDDAEGEEAGNEDERPTG